MVILGVHLEMVRKGVDAFGQQRDLDFGGSGVVLVLLNLAMTWSFWSFVSAIV